MFTKKTYSFTKLTDENEINKYDFCCSSKALEVVTFITGLFIVLRQRNKYITIHLIKNNDIVVSVSYTHLDVYKRQHMHSHMVSARMRV